MGNVPGESCAEWMLIAMRQALDDTSTWRAVGVCGCVIQMVILTLLSAIFVGSAGQF